MSRRSENQIKGFVGGMQPLERDLYRENLAIAKGVLGLPEAERSLEAANLALDRTLANRRVCREKGWIV